MLGVEYWVLGIGCWGWRVGFKRRGLEKNLGEGVGWEIGWVDCSWVGRLLMGGKSSSKTAGKNKH